MSRDEPKTERSEAIGSDVPVRITLLPHAVEAPAYRTEHAAGMDLVAAIDGSVTLEPGRVEAVPTGIKVEIPPGHEGQVRARSGLARQHSIGLPNAPGTIDADYRGEVLVLLLNWGREPYTIRRGDRIAQLVLAPVARARIEIADALTATARGEGGFGHTGR